MFLEVMLRKGVSAGGKQESLSSSPEIQKHHPRCFEQNQNQPVSWGDGQEETGC